MDIPWLRYLANLHEYWIKRLPSFTNFLAAEVPIHFPCRSIEHYLTCFRQLPRYRILTPEMLMQTLPRRAPSAGTAAAKKKYTPATTASDGRGLRRRPRPVPAARTDALPQCTLGRGRGRRRRRLKLAAAGAGGEDGPAAAAGAGGEDGRAAPRDVAVDGAGSAAAGTGALPAGQFCMPAVN